jgi:hypothetical protein
MDEGVQDFEAGGVEAEEPTRLRGREMQAGHLQVFSADAVEQVDAVSFRGNGCRGRTNGDRSIHARAL